jgi:hypothetical protein
VTHPQELTCRQFLFIIMAMARFRSRGFPDKIPDGRGYVATSAVTLDKLILLEAAK